MELQNSVVKIIKLYVDANNADISYKINAVLTFVVNFKNDNILVHLEQFIKKIKKKQSIDLVKLVQVLLTQ